MSFILFMLCITGALFLGMILDRVILKIKDNKEEYEYASISFKDKTTPEAILERLKEILAVNGVIRVYDYYLIRGIKNISSLDFRVQYLKISDIVPPERATYNGRRLALTQRVSCPLTL